MIADAARRLIIVTADDFGLSEDVNRGIVIAHERGIVTATSLMVRWKAAAAAAAYARQRPQLDLGLHVDLGEWRYTDGEWRAVYEVVSLADREGIAQELGRQMAEFRRLAGRNPTHIDTHQHVGTREPARSVLVEAARELGVPLRHATDGIHYCGKFYGQTDTGEALPDSISAAALVDIVSQLPPGVTELACHPSLDRALDTMYRDERVLEVEALCDPAVRAALCAAAIQLTRFSELDGWGGDSAQGRRTGENLDG